jgi:hypothetical protein
MNGDNRPNVCQSDRDAIEDVGLIDLDDHAGTGAHAEHHQEPLPA